MFNAKHDARVSYASCRNLMPGIPKIVIKQYSYIAEKKMCRLVLKFGCCELMRVKVKY